jgi:hypothetical protein
VYFSVACSCSLKAASEREESRRAGAVERERMEELVILIDGVEEVQARVNDLLRRIHEEQERKDPLISTRRCGLA